jgi:glutathione synthase/RimK-type ligase-like ATP-grasp enzyme
MKTKLKKKIFTKFFTQVRSRHPSHSVLRRAIGPFSVRSVIRLGSTTELEDGIKRIEINSVEGIRNSSSKLRMKRCFAQANVKTANWYTYNGTDFISTNKNEKAVFTINELRYPIIAKGIFGSRGQANTKLDSPQALTTWLKGKNTGGYIFEEFFDSSREYRFHISTDGVFLTWRKLRKNDTPDNQRWFFNNQNCNWVSEQHELYNRPATYNEIAKECLKALKSVGLDIGGCDVRVNKKGDFKIIEINSACSLAEVTATAYKAELTKLITNKIKN